MRIVTLVLLAAIGVGVVGCHGWPTEVSNQGPLPASFSYWHSQYDQPSAKFRLDAGESTMLARELRLRDFREIRVLEGGREFVISGAELDRLKQDCPAYRCVITHAGEGRLSSRPWTREDVEAAANCKEIRAEREAPPPLQPSWCGR